MKMTWLNFHDVIPNTLREIEFSLKFFFFDFNSKLIQVVYLVLKAMGVQSIGIQTREEVKITFHFSKLSILRQEK